MSNVWSQSRFGNVIDLVEPTTTQVDLWEICLTLASINRFGGHADPAVSVAYHSLIVADLVDYDHKGYALIHDFHEAYIGDITTPVADALAKTASQLWPDEPIRASMLMRDTIKELKYRHDCSIYAAAGLEYPTPTQKQVIREADLRALITERRDFMAPAPRDWHPGIERIEPAKRTYAAGDFGSTPKRVAWHLMAECEKYLPVFNSERYAA